MKEEADMTLNNNSSLYNNNHNNFHQNAPAPVFASAAQQQVDVDAPLDIPFVANFEGQGKRFTAEEDKRIWDFLLQQPYCHSERSWAQLGEEFQRYAPYRSNRSWANRMKLVLSKINESSDFDNVTKVNLLMKYDFYPQETFVIDISETMNLTLDSRGHIVDYEMKEVDRRSSLERSGPLLPSRIPVPIKNEPVQCEEPEEMEEEQEHEQDLKFATGANPYALGDHLPPDDEEEDYEAEEADQEEEMDHAGEGDVAFKPQLQRMEQSVEQPTLPIFEDIMGSHGVAQQQSEAPQQLYESYFEAMKKSIIEETNAAVRQTLGEFMKKGEEEKTKEPEKASLKQFLSDLKVVVTNFNSPHMGDIEERIEKALLGLEQQDKMIPMDNIHVLLDLAIKMMGH